MSSRRDRCQWCDAYPVSGSICPWSITCPDCQVGPGRECLRPSGHRAPRMHSARYKATEATDAANGVVYPPPRSS